MYWTIDIPNLFNTCQLHNTLHLSISATKNARANFQKFKCKRNTDLIAMSSKYFWYFCSLIPSKFWSLRIWAKPCLLCICSRWNSYLIILWSFQLDSVWATVAGVTKPPGGASHIYWKIFVSFDISFVKMFDISFVKMFQIILTKNVWYIFCQNVSDNFYKECLIHLLSTCLIYLLFQISLTKNVGRTTEKNALVETWWEMKREKRENKQTNKSSPGENNNKSNKSKEGQQTMSK